MKYSDLKQVFKELKRTSPREDLTAHVIFTEDSFTRQYSLLSRTYRFDSDNKAFWPKMGGYSIFAWCLDVTSDQGIRLDWYMAEENNRNGWEVQDCYILEQMQDADAIADLTKGVSVDPTISYYFFGGTCIQARENKENGEIHLEPLSGDQMVNGEWVELPIDRVYGYCTLLTRHLNRERQ